MNLRDWEWCVLNFIGMKRVDDTHFLSAAEADDFSENNILGGLENWFNIDLASLERDLRKRIGFTIQFLFWSVRVFQLLNMTTRVIIHQGSSILNISLDSYPFYLALFSLSHSTLFSLASLFFLLGVK